MKRRRDKQVDAKVLASWRGRLVALRRKLANAPGADDAWFWRVQFHIIHYLMHRYDPEGLRTLADSPENSVVGELLPGAAASRTTSARLLVGSGGAGRMPRVSAEIRPLLADIAEFNRERYEMARQIREELALAIRNHQEQARALMAKYPIAFEAIVEIETAEKSPTLTDEQIREILLNAGFLNLPEDEEMKWGDDEGSSVVKDR